MLLKELVNVLTRNDRSVAATCNIQSLKADVRREVVEAFDAARDLMEGYPDAWNESDSFVDFVFKLCDVPEWRRKAPVADSCHECCDAFEKLQRQLDECLSEKENLRIQLETCERETADSNRLVGIECETSEVRIDYLERDVERYKKSLRDCETNLKAQIERDRDRAEKDRTCIDSLNDRLDRMQKLIDDCESRNAVLNQSLQTERQSVEALGKRLEKIQRRETKRVERTSDVATTEKSNRDYAACLDDKNELQKKNDELSTEIRKLRTQVRRLETQSREHAETERLLDKNQKLLNEIGESRLEIEWLKNEKETLEEKARKFRDETECARSQVLQHSSELEIERNRNALELASLRSQQRQTEERLRQQLEVAIGTTVVASAGSDWTEMIFAMFSVFTDYLRQFDRTSAEFHREFANIVTATVFPPSIHRPFWIRRDAAPLGGSPALTQVETQRLSSPAPMGLFSNQIVPFGFEASAETPSVETVLSEPRSRPESVLSEPPEEYRFPSSHLQSTFPALARHPDESLQPTRSKRPSFGVSRKLRKRSDFERFRQYLDRAYVHLERVERESEWLRRAEATFRSLSVALDTVYEVLARLLTNASPRVLRSGHDWLPRASVEVGRLSVRLDALYELLGRECPEAFPTGPRPVGFDWIDAIGGCFSAERDRDDSTRFPAEPRGRSETFPPELRLAIQSEYGIPSDTPSAELVDRVQVAVTDRHEDYDLLFQTLSDLLPNDDVLSMDANEATSGNEGSSVRHSRNVQTSRDANGSSKSEAVRCGGVGKSANVEIELARCRENLGLHEIQLSRCNEALKETSELRRLLREFGARVARVFPNVRGAPPDREWFDDVATLLENRSESFERQLETLAATLNIGFERIDKDRFGVSIATLIEEELYDAELFEDPIEAEEEQEFEKESSTDKKRKMFRSEPASPANEKTYVKRRRLNLVDILRQRLKKCDEDVKMSKERIVSLQSEKSELEENAKSRQVDLVNCEANRLADKFTYNASVQRAREESREKLEEAEREKERLKLELEKCKDELTRKKSENRDRDDELEKSRDRVLELEGHLRTSDALAADLYARFGKRDEPSGSAFARRDSLNKLTFREIKRGYYHLLEKVDKFEKAAAPNVELHDENVNTWLSLLKRWFSQLFSAYFFLRFELFKKETDRDPYVQMRDKLEVWKLYFQNNDASNFLEFYEFLLHYVEWDFRSISLVEWNTNDVSDKDEFLTRVMNQTVSALQEICK